MSKRPVTVPDSTLEQERRDEDRARGHATAQQPASPCLPGAANAGRVHERSLAGSSRDHAHCDLRCFTSEIYAQHKECMRQRLLKTLAITEPRWS